MERQFDEIKWSEQLRLKRVDKLKYEQFKFNKDLSLEENLENQSKSIGGFYQCNNQDLGFIG